MGSMKRWWTSGAADILESCRTCNWAQAKEELSTIAVQDEKVLLALQHVVVVRSQAVVSRLYLGAKSEES